MLPNSKTSLINGGFSKKAASWTLFLCFLAGAAGIQVVSKIAHRYMPTHVVECDHSHEDEEADADDHHHHHEHQPPRPNPRHELKAHSDGSQCDLLAFAADGLAERHKKPQRQPWGPDFTHGDVVEVARRPVLASNWTGKVTKVFSSGKPFCDEHGQCFGFSDPCGNDCFKIIEERGGSRVPGAPRPRHPGLARSATTPHTQTFSLDMDRSQILENVDEETPLLLQQSASTDLSQSQDLHTSTSASNGHAIKSPSPKRSHSPASVSTTASEESSHHGHAHDHHHHVPQNAFLSIGLQTSLAIALHKLPEGFITYATNHANPSLGFSVFLALFVHNITEGFAMALPLFLAMRSRPRAVLISSLLGGISQPLGAGVAALWFRVAGAGENGSEPGEGVYGVMFAVVAGIMASVALQLFSESLDLTHDRNLCFAFAFVGMGVLGFTSTLTA
jgi:zinc transporter, ZIP family